jgi:UDP-glucose 4-epimerase
MKTLVLGASGYIGANLTVYLSKKGYEVIAAARHFSSAWFGRKNVHYAKIDLAQPTTYRKVLNEVDFVIYLVGPGGVLREQYSSKLIQEHLVLLASFLEENSKLNNCPVLFASSGGTIYGEGVERPFEENDDLEPITPYGLLKLLSEKLLYYFHRNHSTPFISFRISNPYGGISHDKIDQGVINIFVKKILAVQPIEVWGDGSSTRDYIYISDLMLAFESALFRHNINTCINIGSGVGSSLFNICSLIEDETGLEIKREHKPINPKIIDHFVLDICRANALLNWEPRYSIAEGIALFISESKNSK